MSAEQERDDKRLRTKIALDELIELGASDLMKHSMQHFMDMEDAKERGDIQERLCISIFGRALLRIREWNNNHP